MADVVRRRRWGVVTVVAVGTLLAAVLINGSRQESRSRPIERHQAEALLHQAARLAQAGDFTGLCQSVAATSGLCRFLLQSARDAGWEPGPDAPEVVTATRRPASMILRLAGTRLDGSTYTADFEVVREGDDLRSRTPVYWSGVHIVPSECTSSSNHAECTATVAPTTLITAGPGIDLRSVARRMINQGLCS